MMELCAICSDCSMMDPDVEIEPEMYISNCPLRADYIQSIYFTIITMTTVGYGDGYGDPMSAYGKIFNCIIMICTLIVIP